MGAVGAMVVQTTFSDSSSTPHVHLHLDHHRRHHTSSISTSASDIIDSANSNPILIQPSAALSNCPGPPQHGPALPASPLTSHPLLLALSRSDSVPGSGPALHASVRSTARLRKKPHSISSVVSAPIPYAYMPNSTSAQLSPSPNFHTTLPQSESHGNPTVDDTRPSSAGSAIQSSAPLVRSQSNSGHHRSPSQKRKPPASHSSYGVETTNGPPPSYSTQRTLSQDRLWNVERNPGSRGVNTTDRDPAHVNEVIVDPTAIPNLDFPAREETALLPIPRTPDPTISSPDTVDTQSLTTPKESSDMTTPSTAGAASFREDLEKPSETPGLDGAKDDAKGLSSSDDHKSSEDLFLNIAKTDASRLAQPVSKSNQRQSRISLPFFSNARPSSSHKTSPMPPTQFIPDNSTPRSERPQHFGKRSSLGQHVPGALTRSYFDDNPGRKERQLESHLPAEAVEEPPPRSYARRYSNTNNDTLRPSTRSHTGRASRLASESVFSDRLRAGDQVATESTISTTAPSTVWDELDDLKSRIRKLELTGKLPPSSAAAMTSVERPRTATTAATALSNSPKHKTSLTALPSAIEGIPSNIHPLLHEALGNAQGVVSNEVFQKLQATAQDALQLSAMMSGEAFSSTGTTTTMSPASERQIRRRAESMCRSLTELAIALSADSRGYTSPANRPVSRDTFASTTGTGLRARRYSNEPADRPPTSSRVQSRLDNRRSLTSAQGFGSGRASDPVLSTSPASSVPLPTSSSRMSRTSTVTRNRRIPGPVDGANDAEESSPAVARPVSRAMTEVGSYRQLARDRANFSREYTKQHPLPSQAESKPAMRTPLPANLSSNLVSRRTYPSSTSVVGTQESSPITPAPKQPWGAISIERGTGYSPVELTPDHGSSIPRSTGSRRSLGIASRISNVGSRLRAVRAERVGGSNGTGRELGNARSGREIPQLQQDGEGQLQDERHELGIGEA